MLLLIALMAGCDSEAPDSEPEEPVAPFVATRGVPWDFVPNILWLVAEDLSPTIPPYGDSTIVTPTLSRLAAEGVRYTHFFSPSGVCAPSRAAIATGMYPTSIAAQHMRTGPWWAGRPSVEVVQRASESMPDGVQAYEAIPPPQALMLSEYLRVAGYYTTNNRKQDYQFVAPVTAWNENRARAHWSGRAPGQPFFSIFNFEVTHESRLWSKAGDSLLVDPALDVPVPPYLPDNDITRADLRRMYSNVLEMDGRVGKRLDELEQAGLLDSTIVFWFSDHGGPLPRQKRALYDSGIRVPMIVRFPEAWRAGETDDRLLSFVDLLPTALSLAGISPPRHVHGEAFEGASSDDSDRDVLFAASDRLDEVADRRRAARDRRYKYIRNYETGRSRYLPLTYREQIPSMREMLRLHEEGLLDSTQSTWFAVPRPAEELYDTWADPHEIRNLVDDSTHAETLNRLRTALDLWQVEIPDLGMIDEATMLDSLWFGGEQPRTDDPTGSWANGLLTLSSATDGASIGYRIGADVPGADDSSHPWLVYTEPFPVSQDEPVTAIAHRLGYLPSDTLAVNPR